MRLVLDSSAVIAVLQDEPGHEEVVAALGIAILGAINLAEVAAFLARKGATVADVRDALAPLGLPVIAADELLAVEAGCLGPLTRAAGLSLGDRFCLALARRLDAPVLTTDRAWTRIADAVGVEVRLIR